MNYRLIRPILFHFSPELSHNLSLKAMQLLYRLKMYGWLQKEIMVAPREVFGIKFTNPVGLAAGLDKNGDYIDCLAALGFGFIEIGTVTPKPQSGNPKPRLYRLADRQAIINRMGFNNKGVDYLVERVKEKKYQGVLGINIGKNASTSNDNAIDDYLNCFNKVYPYASYITINISSPNTIGLRELQLGDYLTALLTILQTRRSELAAQYGREVPLVVKVAPDLTAAQISEMAAIFCAQKIDGLIITNTALDRGPIQDHPLANEAGGLSGEPIFELATSVLKQFKVLTKDHGISLIASGGIMSAQQARAKITAGADLVQLYTGLIYEGPGLIADCCEALCGT